MQDVQITVAGSAPPPPPTSQGATTTSVRAAGVTINIHTLLALGNLALGVTLAITNVIGLIGSLATFQLLSFTVLLFLLLGGVIVAITALTIPYSFVRYIGFVQFPFGIGLLLVLLGVLNLGTGSVGSIVGGICIGWGVVDILAHLWLRGKGAAVNLPLLKR